jgi:hypothetical protein
MQSVRGTKWHPGKVRPLQGNAPHDRPVSRGIFSLKERLRRSLECHSCLHTAAPRYAFLRHEESINPMWIKTWWGHRLPDPETPAGGDLVRGQGHRSLSAPGHRARPGYQDVSEGARPAHRLDEFHRPFLDRVGRHQSPSPLHRRPQNNTHPAEASRKGDISTLPERGHFSPENRPAHAG